MTEQAKTATEKKPEQSQQERTPRGVDAGSTSQIAELLALPDAAGNAAVSRLIRSSGAWSQTDLRMSQPGDRYEQEADRAARDVMTSQDAAIAIRTGKEERIQAGENPGERAAGDGRIRKQVNSLRGDGRPLSLPLRSFFETRFGQDLSAVRVHADARAREAARSVNALAFTCGADVVFRGENYVPGTEAGNWLLAHELAHVTQHGGGESIVYRQAAGAEVQESTARAREGSEPEVPTPREIIERLQESDQKVEIPLDFDQKVSTRFGDVSIKVKGALHLSPELKSEFKEFILEYEKELDEKGKKKVTSSINLGPDKASAELEYSGEWFTIGVSSTAAESDAYSQFTFAADLAKILFDVLSGGLLDKVDEKTGGAIQPTVEGTIGFVFRYGEGGDYFEIHKNYADIKLAFKVDFGKLWEQVSTMGEDVAEGTEEGLEEGFADVMGKEVDEQEPKKEEEEEKHETTVGAGPAEGEEERYSRGVSGEIGTETDYTVELGAEFHAETTYGEMERGKVTPTEAEVSAKAYVEVQIGYFKVKAHIKGEGKAVGTLGERLEMRDRALASAIIDALSTFGYGTIGKTEETKAMASLVETINTQFEISAERYFADARDKLGGFEDSSLWDLHRVMGGTARGTDGYVIGEKPQYSGYTFYAPSRYVTLAEGIEPDISKKVLALESWSKPDAVQAPATGTEAHAAIQHLSGLRPVIRLKWGEFLERRPTPNQGGVEAARDLLETVSSIFEQHDIEALRATNYLEELKQIRWNLLAYIQNPGRYNRMWERQYGEPAE